MSPPPSRPAPFVSGWRAVALNVLSASVVVTALSSALVAANGAQVVQQGPPPATVRVQVGAVPVSVAWPPGASTAFLQLDVSASGSRTAVLEGVAGMSVQTCSEPWTSTGGCPGRRRVTASAGERVETLVVASSLEHLMVRRGQSSAAAGPLVVRAA